MIFVVPISVVLANTTTQADADQKREKLVQLLNQPMVRHMAMGNGIPVSSMHTEPCTFSSGHGYVAPLWVFLDCPTQEGAPAARGRLSELLSNPAVRGFARANGVEVGSIVVGEASVFNPRR